jgi:YbbR domain-containing protein
MSKLLKKIGRLIFRIFEVIFRIIDRLIVMPISRLVYNLTKALSGNNSNFNKLLNRPQFLIVLSLIFSVICFLLIDNKVIRLVETEAEVIKNVPVSVIYNEEAYVVENVPELVDITITGRKSDIYLAKQLGDFSVELDLSKYSHAGTYKAYLEAKKSIGTVDYILDPSYLTVAIKDKVSEVFTVSYDLVSTDELDEKLSVGSVSLDTTEVVVKGSQDALDEISSIKALVSAASSEFKNAETYEVTNIPVIAYNKKGEIIKNVEIVPKTLNGSIVLKSYKATVPVAVTTTGQLLSGKAIASITINNNDSYSLDIYGEESDIKNITTVNVPINIDGLGQENVKKYTVNINKPTGVRYMSAKNVTIAATF